MFQAKETFSYNQGSRREGVRSRKGKGEGSNINRTKKGEKSTELHPFPGNPLEGQRLGWWQGATAALQEQSNGEEAGRLGEPEELSRVRGRSSSHA